MLPHFSHTVAAQSITTTGEWYARTDSTRRHRHYRLGAEVCRQCPLYDSCVSVSAKGNRRGRTLSRAEFAGAAERNRQRLKNKPEVYPQRQALVEHPFGTIKRSWGGYYTLLRGLSKVDGEYSLLACCYNLRRSMSLLGVVELVRLLRGGVIGENGVFGLLGELRRLILAPLRRILRPIHFWPNYARLAA